MRFISDDLRLVILRGKFNLANQRTRDIRRHYPVVGEYTEYTDEDNDTVIRHLFIDAKRWLGKNDH